MTKFLLVYFGGNEMTSPEQGAKHMAAWKAWMQGLGDAVVDPGMPVSGSKTISSDGVMDGGVGHVLSGYTVIQADSMDAAVVMAQACPHIDNGGTLEVANVLDMQM